MLSGRLQEHQISSELRRRRAGILAVMFAFGVIYATWATRTPAIRDELGVSIAQMGILMMGLSAGSMVGVLSSAKLISKFGTRRIVAVGVTVSVCALALIGIFTTFESSPGVAIGLALVGLGMGISDVALNIEGAEIEHLTRRSLLPALHGFFSVGTVIGALAGIGFSAINLAPVYHLCLAAAILGPLATWGYLGIPRGFGIVDKGAVAGAAAATPAEAAAPDGPVQSDSAPDTSAPAKQRSVLLDPTILLIGVIILAMGFAEGSADDWLPLLIVDSQGASEMAGSLVYTGFAASMALGRLAGGAFVQRFGHAQVLAVSAVMAVFGVLGVIYAPNVGVAMAAVLFWGVGSSLGFPVAISTAGNTNDRPIKRVSTVTTWGYAAFLVGPPLLGFMGEHIGLGNALLLVAALLVLAAVAATVLTRRLRSQLPLPEGP